MTDTNYADKATIEKLVEATDGGIRFGVAKGKKGAYTGWQEQFVTDPVGNYANLVEKGHNYGILLKSCVAPLMVIDIDDGEAAHAKAIMATLDESNVARFKSRKGHHYLLGVDAEAKKLFGRKETWKIKPSATGEPIGDVLLGWSVCYPLDSPSAAIVKFSEVEGLAGLMSGNAPLPESLEAIYSRAEKAVMGAMEGERNGVMNASLYNMCGSMAAIGAGKGALLSYALRLGDAYSEVNPGDEGFGKERIEDEFVTQAIDTAGMDGANSLAFGVKRSLGDQMGIIFNSKYGGKGHIYAEASVKGDESRFIVWQNDRWVERVVPDDGERQGVSGEMVEIYEDLLMRLNPDKAPKREQCIKDAIDLVNRDNKKKDAIMGFDRPASNGIVRILHNGNKVLEADTNRGTVKVVPNKKEFMLLADMGEVAEWESPLWKKFLADIFPDEHEEGIPDFIADVMAATLVSSINSKFVLCLGEGSNGKSVFQSVYPKIFGPRGKWATKVAISNLDNSTNIRQLAALKGMVGAVCVAIPEIGDGKLDTETIKAMHGGDPVAVGGMHQNSTEVIFSHTTFASSNGMPKLGAASHAVRRRIYAIRFNRLITDEEADVDMEEKLKKELPAIRRWFLSRFEAYVKGGCGPIDTPECVAVSTKGYSEDQDSTLSADFNRWFERVPCNAAKIKVGRKNGVGALGVMMMALHSHDGNNGRGPGPTPRSVKRALNYIESKSGEKVRKDVTDNGALYDIRLTVEGWKALKEMVPSGTDGGLKALEHIYGSQPFARYGQEDVEEYNRREAEWDKEHGIGPRPTPQAGKAPSEGISIEDL